MALFWHGHYAVNESKVRDYRKMLDEVKPDVGWDRMSSVEDDDAGTDGTDPAAEAPSA